ncbi:MAG: transposase [bacterium]|nr:transposase [bacterium]
MRKVDFANGEIFHVYNRGVDKRPIVFDKKDSDRFIKSLIEFNSEKPIGSIFENSFEGNKKDGGQKLVKIICYCLNPNHYHILLEQVTDKGIEKFMHRLGTGYSKYFNHRYKRSGALLQGRFKAVHVTDNRYLLHLSAYINLNDLVHQLGRPTSKLVRSSWGEYLKQSKNSLVNPEIILDQFDNIEDYKKFTEEALEIIKENKEENRELEALLITGED